MIPPLDQIRSRYVEAVIPHLVAVQSEVEEMLDVREADEELGLNWQQVHQVLEALWSTQATQTTRAIDRIRREVYLAAYSVTQSPDCAAYSSEDFGLFAMASVVGFHDAWLEALYQEYERMGFAT